MEKKEIKLYSNNPFGLGERRNEKETKKVSYVLCFILIIDLAKMLLWKNEVK